MNLSKWMSIGCCVIVSVAATVAQTSATPLSGTQASGAQNAPVSVSSIAELNQIVDNLKQTSQSIQEHLGHMRIEKWKTDSSSKRQTQSDSESIMRNLQNAMPSILSDLQNAPESLPLTFKTYRNLDALYDVLTSVVESTGAFGSKDDFQSLNNDLNAVDNSRHAFADRMDKLANAKEHEVGELRVALAQARAAIPPKKTVVDDTEPAQKKPVPHKKAVPKPGANKPPANTPPAQKPAQPPQKPAPPPTPQ